MNEQGSVSLYAVIVLVPIVLFLGVLVDAARYHAADRMAEQQTKAAVRSVLSGYDRKLRDEYGLFGLAAPEAGRQAVADAVFAGPEGGFAAAHPRLLELSVEPVYSLADHRFFRRQILEEMKVKGPVEFARRVYDNWREQAEEMNRAAETAEWSEEAEKELRAREDALRDAFRTVERMGGRMEQGRAILGRPPPVPPPPPEQEGDGAGAPPPAPAVPENPYADALPLFAALQGDLEQLGEHLRKAEEAEHRIRAAMDGEAGDLLAGVPIYGPDHYDRYKLEAGRAVSRFGAAAGAANADPANWTADLAFAAEHRAFHARLAGEERARRQAFDEIERRKDEQRSKTREQLDNVRNKLAEQACTPEEEAHVERLAQSAAAYLQYNNAVAGGEGGPDPAGVVRQEPDGAQKNALLLLRRLSGILADIRDEALINEYVLLYFSNRVTGKNGAPLMEHVARHPLKDEAEYVLYGLGGCSANRAAAYAELFTVRFAIRTVEALVDVRKAASGSPLLVLLTAAAEGAVKAYGDLERLLDGDALPAFRRTPNLKMGYEDYLRLFLALHANETKKMARLQALIELNTGVRLQDRPVYVKAVSRAGMRLYMLPAVVRRLLPDAEEGEGRSVIIVKQAEMAY